MTRPLLQVLLALTLVLAANYFWDPRPALQPDHATSKRQVALPQTYIDGARSRAFDEQGNLSDIVEAERARSSGSNRSAWISWATLARTAKPRPIIKIDRLPIRNNRLRSR